MLMAAGGARRLARCAPGATLPVSALTAGCSRALARALATTAGGESGDGGEKKKEPKSAAARLSSPVQNLRDVMDALDVMIEEAEKKVVKKYRPNMFAEFKQLNDTDGKVAVGPEQLVEVGKANRVPSLPLEALDGSSADLKELVTNGKLSLVLTSFKNFGLNMLPAWRDAFREAFPATSPTGGKVQVLTVNIIEDWYMKLVQSSIRRGLMQATPEHLHATTFAHFGRCDDFRTPMDLNNSFVGYAHLVDTKGRIRWIAGGPATPEETQRLIKVTKELLAQKTQSSTRR